MAVTFPKRFDEQEAKKGVWFDVYDEHDNFYGSYLCRMFDKHSAVTKMFIEKYNRTYRKETSGQNFTQEMRDAHFLIHTCLMDWKLKDDKGKDVPYSVEEAMKVLSQEDAGYVVEFLFSCAKNTANFRPADHPAEAQDEAAKN
jgi:hypothetical protein